MEPAFIPIECLRTNFTSKGSEGGASRDSHPVTISMPGRGGGVGKYQHLERERSIAQTNSLTAAETLFQNTEFQFLSQTAQNMAVSMIEAPKEALLASARMRRIKATGMRNQLIVKLCQAYDKRTSSQANTTM